MAKQHGWTVSEYESADGVELECRYYDFKGVVSLTQGSDIHSVKGKGMVRSRYVLISTTCQDKRKVDALIVGNEIVSGFEKTFSYIGAAFVGVLGLMIQVVVLRVISLEVTAGCFIAGFFLGGLFGYLMGDRIAAYRNRNQTVTTFDGQVDMGVARADWSDFIKSIIEPVDTFALEVESKPSTATIL